MYFEDTASPPVPSVARQVLSHSLSTHCTPPSLEVPWAGAHPRSFFSSSSPRDHLAVAPVASARFFPFLPPFFLPTSLYSRRPRPPLCSTSTHISAASPYRDTSISSISSRFTPSSVTSRRVSRSSRARSTRDAPTPDFPPARPRSPRSAHTSDEAPISPRKQSTARTRVSQPQPHLSPSPMLRRRDILHRQTC